MLFTEQQSMAEPPVATKREIRGLYLSAMAHGPLTSAVIIFIQLLIVRQTKYLAAEGSEGENWIEWRDQFADGDLCNGTGTPHPKDSEHPYERPEGYSDDCIWFPSDKTVPGLGIQYTNAVVYSMAAFLFLSGVLLLIMGPFSDYGHYRKRLLTTCVAAWVPIFSLMFLVSDPDLYFVAMLLTALGMLAYVFGLRSPLASYLPLLVNSSHELTEVRHRLKTLERKSQAEESITIEMVPQLDQKAVSEVFVGPALDEFSASTSENGNRDRPSRDPSGSSGAVESFGNQSSALEKDRPVDGRLMEQGRVPSNVELQSLREEYQNRYEAVAGKLAIGQSVFFIAAQFICLIVQFGLLLLLADHDDPRDTLGERSAILVATAWGAIFSYLGIKRFKTREGAPFPPGNKFMIGTRRSIKTFKLLYERLPRLLCLMIGRMFFWLATYTLLTMSTLFFEREFAMTSVDMAPVILLYMAVAVPSGFATSFFIQRYPGNLLKIFLACCLLKMCLPLYMLVGVRERYEVYILMCVSAALLTPFPALVRAMMADMIPRGYTATIMSFEGLLENCTTWIGPLIVGGLLDLTDSLRLSLFALEVFMLAGLPFVFCTHLEKGREQKLQVERWISECGMSNSSKSPEIVH